jgi:hypothetical protein
MTAACVTAARARSRTAAFALALFAAGCTLETDLGGWVAPDVVVGDDAAPFEPSGDGGVDAAACTSVVADAGACAVDDSGTAGDLLTVTPGLTTSYFADRASLPAGEYTLSYVDGCWRSGAVSWTVNLGDEGYWVVGGSPEQRLGPAPGSVGTFASGLGAFARYEECVAANVGRPGITFSFAGGPLGLAMESFDPVTFFVLTQGGESVGGLSPTFRLTRKK